MRPSRLQPSSDSDYRYASRSVPLPNPEEKDLPSEIDAAACEKCPSRCRKQSAALLEVPGQSAAPLGGARARPLRPSLGGAWRLQAARESQRDRWED